MIRSAVIVFATASLLGSKAFADDERDRFLVEATAQVVDRLRALKAPEAHVQPVSDKVVAELFPNHVFVVVGFRQWPVAITPPEPLRSRNLFAVSKKFAAEHLRDAKQLEAFFKSHLPAMAKPKAAVQSWLRLSQEFVQDGFFKFTISDRIEMLAGSSLTIVSGTAEVVPENGNKGALKVSLRFDRDNKLASVTEENKVLAGIRPRCQAKLLLHPDSIIRAIAEQDLLVLGQAGREYLMQQRAAAGPEMQAAIDRVWRRIVDEGR